jgi:hypothetical protein
MSRSLKEVPFAIDDIVAPGSDDRAEEIYSDSVIPIYSFTGSPIKSTTNLLAKEVATATSRKNNGIADEPVDLSESGASQDLESYFAKMQMVDAKGNPEDGEDEVHDDQEVTGNDYLDDEDFGNYLNDEAAPKSRAIKSAAEDDDFEDDLLAEMESADAAGDPLSHGPSGLHYKKKKKKHKKTQHDYIDEEDGNVPSYGTLKLRGTGVELSKEAMAEIDLEITSWKQYQTAMLEKQHSAEVDVEGMESGVMQNQNMLDISVRTADYEDIFEQMDQDSDFYDNDAGKLIDLANEAAISSIEELAKTEPGIMGILTGSSFAADKNEDGVNDDSDVANSSILSSADVVRGIMDEYNEMISALRSPRPFSKGVMGLSNRHRSPLKSNIPIKSYSGEDDEDGDSEDDDMDDDDINDGGRSRQKLRLQQRQPLPMKKIKVIEVYKKKTTDPVELYQRNRQFQERQRSKGGASSKPLDMAAGSTSKAGAGDKHKQWLQSVQEKRRMEEEALLLEAQRAIEKRKKFKEALLEKALANKQQQVEQQGALQQQQKQIYEELAKKPADTRNSLVQPHHRVSVRQHSNPVTQPSQPSASPSVPAAATAGQRLTSSNIEQAPPVTFVTASERLKAEEEKKEQIATIRRKFKEQHKQTLLALMEKNRQQQQQSEEEVRLAEADREKRRQRALLLAAKREHSQAAPVPAHQNETGVTSNATVSGQHCKPAKQISVVGEASSKHSKISNIAKYSVDEADSEIPLSELNTVIVNPATSVTRAKLKQEQMFDIEVTGGTEDGKEARECSADLNATIGKRTLMLLSERDDTVADLLVCMISGRKCLGGDSLTISWSDKEV